MSAARDNPRATTFCRAHPNEAFVPAYASGHDAAYTFRCQGGEAEASGITFPLDERGFAATVWAPVD